MAGSTSSERRQEAIEATPITIFAGTNEIMKVIIAKRMGLGG